MTAKKYNYTSALLAFVLWSLWAYFINVKSSNVMVSALAQGVASFVITLIMIKLLVYFYRLFPKGGWYFIVPSLATVGMTSSFVLFIHFMVHTKNILYTVLPTVIVAFLFALYTTKKIIEEES
jgi:ABC-type antimicrobial peptide transport system permease subunit